MERPSCVFSSFLCAPLTSPPRLCVESARCGVTGWLTLGSACDRALSVRHRVILLFAGPCFGANARVNRLTALLLATVLWAGIFLPGLGSLEMKGEEGRRVMPAVTMAEGGGWVVPHV